jgi:integrase
MNAHIEKYVQYATVNKLSPETIRVREYFLKRMDKDKPIQDWSKDDIDIFLFELSKSKSQATVESAKAHFKAFYKFLGLNERTDHLKIKTIDCPLDRDDILTEAEVQALIDATASHLYKALIMLMFESGARISELLKIKVSDVKETNEGMFVPAYQTKRGKAKRTILCYYSAKYIRNLILYGSLSPHDYLFKSGYAGKKTAITVGSVDEQLKVIAKEAGITKPVRCHAFRHACATNMILQNYNIAIIKKGLGWKPESRAINRYLHIVDDDVTRARLEKLGQLKPTIINEPALKLADEIQIADDKTLLRRLAVENQELHKLKEELELLKKAFGMTRTPEGNFTFEAQIKEFPTDHPATKKDKGFAVITDKELK